MTSFRPLHSKSLSSALLGTADPTKFVDVARKDVDFARSDADIARKDIDFARRDADVARKDSDLSLYERRIHGPEEPKINIRYTIIIVIISAIIFVTVISIYDIFRNLISNYFAKITLNDPNSHNTQEQINTTLISNHGLLISSIIFSLFCIVTGTIIIYILLQFL